MSRAARRAARRARHDWYTDNDGFRRPRWWHRFLIPKGLR